MAVATLDTLEFAHFKELATKDDLRETELRLNGKLDTVVAKLTGEMTLLK